MKQSEINQLTVEDVRENLDSSLEKMKKLLLSHKVSPLENPLQIRALRKDIARLNTELVKRNNQ